MAFRHLKKEDIAGGRGREEEEHREASQSKK